MGSSEAHGKIHAEGSAPENIIDLDLGFCAILRAGKCLREPRRQNNKGFQMHHVELQSDRKMQIIPN